MQDIKMLLKRLRKRAANINIMPSWRKRILPEYWCDVCTGWQACQCKYVEEALRSAYIREREHLKALHRGEDGSVTWKHCPEGHKGHMVQFVINVTGVFRYDVIEWLVKSRTTDLSTWKTNGTISTSRELGYRCSEDRSFIDNCYGDIRCLCTRSNRLNLNLNFKCITRPEYLKLCHTWPTEQCKIDWWSCCYSESNLVNLKKCVKSILIWSFFQVQVRWSNIFLASANRRSED